MVSGKTMILGMMGIACSLLMACSSTQQDCLGEMPVIAEKVTLPTGDLIVCDLAKATDTLDVPLSMLTEELQIVPLDNRDEALGNSWKKPWRRKTWTNRYKPASKLAFLLWMKMEIM